MNDMDDIDYINLSIDQGDYENAAILALKTAQRRTVNLRAADLTAHAHTLSNLALVQELRKARR